MAKRSKLTAKQQKFVDNYLVSLNSTQSAIQAGYSKKTAPFIGYENLKKPQIADAIEKALLRQQERTQITADKVLNELALVAFLNISKAYNKDGSLLDINQMPEDIQRAIAGMDLETRVDNDGTATRTKKIKLNDKLKALELIGRHFKMFTDKQELSGPDGKPLEHHWTAEIIDARDPATKKS